MEWFLLIEKVAASIFIIFMGILLLFWCLPEGYFFRDFLHKKFGRYICWAGLDNYWALFAPQPLSRNFLIGFELEFSDGRRKPFQLPEFGIKNGYQGVDHVRFAKMHNQLLSQKDPVPKEAICRYILRAWQKRHPSEIAPVRIHIIRYYEPEMKDIIGIPWLNQAAFTYETAEGKNRLP